MNDSAMGVEVILMWKLCTESVAYFYECVFKLGD